MMNGSPATIMSPLHVRSYDHREYEEREGIPMEQAFRMIGKEGHLGMHECPSDLKLLRSVGTSTSTPMR